MFLRRLRENSQPIAMLFAICLALIAQYLFTGEIFTHQRNSNYWEWNTKYSLALFLLFLAIGFAAWAAFPHQKTTAETDQTFLADAPKGRRAWLIGSGVSYLLSNLLYVFWGENAWVRLLWLAGICFLLIPFWLETWGKPVKNPVTSWEWMFIGLIVLVGFGLRYWKLTELPSHVDNDVALMGTFAGWLITKDQQLQLDRIFPL